VSWLRQEVASPPEGTVVEVFAQAVSAFRDEAAATLLRFGLLREDEFDRSVRDLSVGQRRRLDLAIVLAAPGGLLLLDEPTNHLDPELVEQLEHAVQSHPGAVVTVTHDRHWLQRAVGTPHVQVSDGRAEVRDG